MSRYRFIPLCLMVTGLALSTRSELSAVLHPQCASLFIHEPFTLVLEVTGAQSPQWPQFPGIPECTVLSTDTEPPSAKQSTHRMFIELIAGRSGVITVPPLTIADGEQSVRTAPLRLNIAAPRPAEEMTLTATVLPSRLYEQQPAVLQVEWRSTVPFPRCQELVLEIPLLRSPSWTVYPLTPEVPETRRIGLPVNGQRLIAELGNADGQHIIRFSFILIPRDAGGFRNQKLHLACALSEQTRPVSQYPSYFDNHFFQTPGENERYARIYQSGTLPDLEVTPLPPEGRTPRFTGVAAGCTANAAVQPSECVTGQPLLLTIRLTGLPCATAIDSIPAAALRDTGPEFRINPDPFKQQQTADTAVFTYILRPLRSGISKIPAISLQFFDPDQKTYRTVRTQALDIRVDPDGEKTHFTPEQGSAGKPQGFISGIRQNRNGSPSHMILCQLLEFLSRHALLLWLVPPVLWIALQPWIRRRDRCRTDPVYARASRAAGRFRRTVRRDEETAWRNYLADRFNLHADAVTGLNIEPELQRRGAGPQLTADVLNRFRQSEISRYAPAGTPPRPAMPVRDLVRKIEKTIPLLLLLIFCLPDTGNARSAEDVFAQAMQIRNEKPDEAAPAFIEAALGFEAAGMDLNAGNSWFFAGQSGRALANYLAAESRRPFDRQIRESIAFIRAQRDGAAAASETPRVLKLPSRILRWNTRLQFGLLTGFYLSGWGLFAAARIAGKRLPRRLAIPLAILPLLSAVTLVIALLRPDEGVVIQPAEPRLGPGFAYGKAAETILPEAAEFRWKEERDGWVLAGLPDDEEVWILRTACIRVR